MSRTLPRTVKEELKRHGFILKRSTRHDVYKNHAGRMVVLSQSPSDVNAEWAMLKDIRKPVVIQKDTDSSGVLVIPRQEKQRRSGGMGYTKTEGTGYTYLPAKPVTTTDEQREADRLRSMQDKVIERCGIAQKRWERDAENLLQKVFADWKMGITRWNTARDIREHPEDRLIYRLLSKEERQRVLKITNDDWKISLTLNVRDILVKSIINDVIDDVQVSWGGDWVAKEETVKRVIRWVVERWRELLDEMPKPKWFTGVGVQNDRF